MFYIGKDVCDWRQNQQDIKSNTDWNTKAEGTYFTEIKSKTFQKKTQCQGHQA